MKRYHLRWIRQDLEKKKYLHLRSSAEKLCYYYSAFSYFYLLYFGPRGRGQSYNISCLPGFRVWCSVDWHDSSFTSMVAKIVSRNDLSGGLGSYYFEFRSDEDTRTSEND
jgi:hypothetical protein